MAKGKSKRDNGEGPEDRFAVSRPAARVSPWAQRRAVAVLDKRLKKFESALGVGFGAMEDSSERMTGVAGLIVFVDLRLANEVEQVRKLFSKGVGGYPVQVRAPRTTLDVPGSATSVPSSSMTKISPNTAVV